MKALINKSKTLLPIILGLFILTSCEDEETQEAFGFLLGFFIFLGGTILTSIPAIVLSSVSISNRSKVVFILAILFTVLSTFFLIAELNLFMEAAYQGDKNTIIVFPAITFMMIILCIVMIVIGVKRSASEAIKSKLSNNDLDKIIEDSEDVESDINPS
ncbi:MAG: hypothetical protein ACI9N1_000863 [Flavobacteriales bacterium]|jgi:hypothetical protein